MQETQAWPPIWEDPIYQGSWIRVPQALSQGSRAQELQLLHPRSPEPVHRNKRSHGNEKPHTTNTEEPALSAIKRKACSAVRTQHNQKQTFRLVQK